MPKMLFNRAKEISDKLVACAMHSEGEVPKLPKCSLAEMLEATAIVRAENNKSAAGCIRKKMYMTCADRVIAAMYTIDNYHTDHQTSDNIEPIMIMGSVGLFNLELTAG
ncbi:hypothetical protein [Desulfovibrio sp. UCD-KL4C]|uniref:hypothetical protein n=1 Tax=Desulfovibrio sp. UCD-KL4C TaxID=2578120 RepID=UPI0025B86C0F|nr:hypothetical protein [Desulfovibrio sp. UCD-KL4C]